MTTVKELSEKELLELLADGHNGGRNLTYASDCRVFDAIKKYFPSLREEIKNFEEACQGLYSDVKEELVNMAENTACSNARWVQAKKRLVRAVLDVSNTERKEKRPKKLNTFQHQQAERILQLEEQVGHLKMCLARAQTGGDA